MIGYHRLSDETLVALAAGHGGTRAVRALRAAQLSKHLLLLKHVAEAAHGLVGERDRAARVLAEAQARDPDVVADVLADPMVGAWLVETTRRIRAAGTDGAVGSPDLRRLLLVAAVAAVRTGSAAEFTVAAQGDRVNLPTLGTAVLPADDGRVRVVVDGRGIALRTDRGEVVVAVDGDGPHPPGWQPRRRLRGPAGFALPLEDLDPHRDCYHVPAAGRLTDAAFRHWQRLFAEASELLTTYLPDRAQELSAGLGCVVPLADPGDGPARSATARHTFGAFGLTCPRSAEEFAITLVHEFQHSKLSAVLDLVPLYDRAAPETYFAPWRLDPRPIGGLLQGVYAFLAVADAWERLRGSPPLRAGAEREFAELREQVRHALGSLEESSRLTRSGLRFAAGMRATLEILLARPVPDELTSRARAGLSRTEDAWRQRNRQPALD